MWFACLMLDAAAAQVLGMDVPVSKALAGCMMAAGVVALLAVVRILSVILGIVPDSIKLAVVRLGWGGAAAVSCSVLSSSTGCSSTMLLWFLVCLMLCVKLLLVWVNLVNTTLVVYCCRLLAWVCC